MARSISQKRELSQKRESLKSKRQCGIWTWRKKTWFCKGKRIKFPSTRYRSFLLFKKKICQVTDVMIISDKLKSTRSEQASTVHLSVVSWEKLHNPMYFKENSLELGWAENRLDLVGDFWAMCNRSVSVCNSISWTAATTKSFFPT